MKEAITDYLEKYGRVCRLWKFGLPIIFIGEGKAAEVLFYHYGNSFEGIKCCNIIFADPSA